jgi:hypothetical protein
VSFRCQANNSGEFAFFGSQYRFKLEYDMRFRVHDAHLVTIGTWPNEVPEPRGEIVPGDPKILEIVAREPHQFEIVRVEYNISGSGIAFWTH